jgi:hypothetical protein
MLDKVKKKQSSLVIYCMLDRIPIIVFGDDENKTDDFLVELTELIHFRKEVVFYSDFISLNEYEILIQNENIDYNSQRSHIRCPTNVALKALNQFNNFSSWLIGIVIPKQKENYYFIKNEIRKKIQTFLCITISNGSISLEIEGFNPKNIDLTLEDNILQKISRDTERSITSMKRTLSETVKTNVISKDLLKILLDFQVEKKELKKNIFKKEIQNFYSGSKRAYFIFIKLKVLKDLNVQAMISSKTLLDTIAYVEVPIERILSFIQKEWGEDFSDLVDYDKKAILADKISSGWGLET